MAADSPKMSDVVDPTTTSSILLLEWLVEQNWVGIEKDVILCGLWHAMQSTVTLNERTAKQQQQQNSINNNSNNNDNNIGIEKDVILCGLWHAMQSTDTLNEINSEKQYSINNNNNNSMGIEKDLIICSSQSTSKAKAKADYYHNHIID